MDRGQRSSRGNAPSPPPGAVPTPGRAQSPSARLAARLALALPHRSCGPRPRQGSEVMSPGAFFGPRDPVVVQRVSAGSRQQVDLRSIGDARKGYIRGTGQPSPGHAILHPLPHLSQRSTVIEPPAHVQEGVLGPQGSASACSNTHAQSLGHPKLSIFFQCPVSTARAQSASLSSPCLFARSACAAEVSPCVRASKGMGRSERETPGKTGAGQGSRALTANGGRPNVR